MKEPPREALWVLTKELTKGPHAMAMDKSALLELTTIGAKQRLWRSADANAAAHDPAALIGADAAQHIGADAV
jgi:hypothetical protein